MKPDLRASRATHSDSPQFFPGTQFLPRDAMIPGYTTTGVITSDAVCSESRGDLQFLPRDAMVPGYTTTGVITSDAVCSESRGDLQFLPRDAMIPGYEINETASITQGG
ncbi:MAG: hypothetical protein V2A56_10690 [bacterium]